jgi:YD repeat-containing protein
VGNLTNVTSPSYSGNVARAYGYDALGRLTNMVDAAGTTTYTDCSVASFGTFRFGRIRSLSAALRLGGFSPPFPFCGRKG